MSASELLSSAEAANWDPQRIDKWQDKNRSWRNEYADFCEDVATENDRPVELKDAKPSDLQ